MFFSAKERSDHLIKSAGCLGFVHASLLVVVAIVAETRFGSTFAAPVRLFA
jgi:hypothetical protein